MMHAILRTPTDSLHLIGYVDAHNVDSLQQYASEMAREGDLSLLIEVAPGDAPELEREAGDWLRRLVERGVAVVVRPTDHWSA